MRGHHPRSIAKNILCTFNENADSEQYKVAKNVITVRNLNGEELAPLDSNQGKPRKKSQRCDFHQRLECVFRPWNLGGTGSYCKAYDGRVRQIASILNGRRLFKTRKLEVP